MRVRETNRGGWDGRSGDGFPFLRKYKAQNQVSVENSLIVIERLDTKIDENYIFIRINLLGIEWQW